MLTPGGRTVNVRTRDTVVRACTLADFSHFKVIRVGFAYLLNCVSSMHAIKHLPGDAILEVSKQNNAYTEDELAHALLPGKVSLTGAFLKVA